jgi:hypothetical protein
LYIRDDNRANTELNGYSTTDYKGGTSCTFKGRIERFYWSERGTGFREVFIEGIRQNVEVRTTVKHSGEWRTLIKRYDEAVLAWYSRRDGGIGGSGF